MTFRLLFLFLIGFTPSIAFAQTTADTLATLARAFSEAYMRGDTEAIVAMYTEDAAIFPGNTDILQGRDAIRAYWTPNEGSTITNHHITPVEVIVEGNMASDYGYYEVSGRTNGEDWGPAYGKYVIVWRRGDDGQWRMHLDMWNRWSGPEE